MVCKSWSELERAIKNRMNSAILDAGIRANQELQNNLDRFYSYQNSDPEYKRTGHLRNSWNYDYTEAPDGAVVQLQLETDEPYETGTYTTQMVFENADSGRPQSNIAGIPYFWSDTMDRIENEILPMSMLSSGFIR